MGGKKRITALAKLIFPIKYGSFGKRHYICVPIVVHNMNYKSYGSHSGYVKRI